MSETDPYAAVEYVPNVIDADVTESKEAIEEPQAAVVDSFDQKAAEKPVEAPVSEEQSVPEGSIKEVLGWVREDATRAQAALDAEKAGEKRTTLISKLEAIIN